MDKHYGKYGRRQRPPHFRPIMIIVVVLALGVFVIGLVLTIIGHWPGVSSIGSDPLEIAGPILMAIGFVVFIIAMVDICRRMNKKKEMQRQQAYSMPPPPSHQGLLQQPNSPIYYPPQGNQGSSSGGSEQDEGQGHTPRRISFTEVEETSTPQKKRSKSSSSQNN